MKYRLVIFDSDGTLADTLPWMRSIFNELAATHGFRRVEAHEYEAFRDLHGREMLKALQLPLWKVPQVMNDMRKRMSEQGETLSLFPGISELLQGLAQCQIQTAIVSSNSRENVERILGRENVQRFNHFNCGASLFGKTSKIKAVIRASKLSARETIYIGDEIRDGEAARDAGIAFGAVTWGQHSEQALRMQKPDYLFRSVSELHDQLCASAS